jgi:hypothetical protein
MMILNTGGPFRGKGNDDYPGHFIFGLTIVFIAICLAAIGFVGYMIYTTLP